MNFGPKFQMSLQVVYLRPQASVRINGMMSEHFDVLRGMRQGCPVSPLLFALAMEPLVEALQRSDGFQGIQIGKCSHKLSLFADNLVRNP